MNEPQDEMIRYAFGYSDRKPSLTWWIVQAVVCAIALYGCVTITAGAQDPTMPKTVPFSNRSGKQIGTATMSGNRIYLRNLDGEPLATIVIDRDNTRTIYDAHGKIIDQLPGGASASELPAK